MGILEALTLIFVCAKVFGAVDWPWLVVFSPMIGAVALYVLLVLAAVVGGARAERKWRGQ